MYNHPEDCHHKQCPWDDPVEVVCLTCINPISEDEDNIADEYTRGFCSECIDLMEHKEY
jgi:hypothetical protein